MTTISIYWYNREHKVNVEAEVNGNWAIHKQNEGLHSASYTLTYVPSGCYAFKLYSDTPDNWERMRALLTEMSNAVPVLEDMGDNYNYGTPEQLTIAKAIIERNRGKFDYLCEDGTYWKPNPR